MSSNLLKHHAELVDQMARTRGIDLEEAVIRANLAPDDLSEMVLQCTRCTQAQACAGWLSAQVGQVSETPPYCRNAHTFRSLAANGSGRAHQIDRAKKAG